MRSGLCESDIMVTSASGLHATPIGEYVRTVMLMFCKQAHTFIRAQERKEWVRFMPQELFGKTVGIVGLGHIGTEVARLSKTFGCRVLAIRRSITERSVDDQIGELMPPSELPSLLAESDFVVLAMPLTEETRHLIGKPELAAMKQSAVLINIARGAVVDQDALIEAPKSGGTAGAGLDGVHQEPLPGGGEPWGGGRGARRPLGPATGLSSALENSVGQIPAAPGSTERSGKKPDWTPEASMQLFSEPVGQRERSSTH